MMTMGLQAQDIHFTQFQNAPLYQSPAMTGLMSADYRINGIYRSQWESVPVQYRTFGFGFDMKILETKNGVLGGGILINRDQAGDSKLALTSALLSAAYTAKLGKKILLTLGVNGGVAQRSIDYSALTFDNQFNGDVFLQESSTGEDMSDNRNFYGDIGTGANFRFQSSRRTKFDIGASVLHLNQPNQAFRDESLEGTQLPMRVSAYLNSSFQISTRSDILVRGLLHRQSTYSENAIGLGWRHHLSFKKSKETAISFSTHYRFSSVNKDAINPMIEFEYGSWKAGLSYDVNISNFNIATDRRGGPEIAVIYTITKVKPLPEYKACPIF